jgi:hypothetical protein
MPTSAKSKSPTADRATLLAQRLTEALGQGRIIPRFVDSYVVDNGRHALQVHASLYKDLLTLLQREALLTMSAHALDLISKGATEPDKKKAKPLPRKDAAVFRQRFLAALTREQHWNAGATLEFQTDLQMYEGILARAAARPRSRKPFGAANHPFVDRSAFLLDSSFLENARVAASRALTNLEAVTENVATEIFQ